MKKVLVVVDYQYDFADPFGKLSVPAAETISQQIQKKIDDPTYDMVIYTLDTHTKEEYAGSEEASRFPMHCEFETPGWDLYNITPKNINLISIKDNFKRNDSTYFSAKNEHFFTKSTNDMWENEVFTQWVDTNLDIAHTVFDVVGVAYEFCVKDLIVGLLNRNCVVNLIDSCCTAISSEGKQTTSIMMQRDGLNIK